MCLLQFISPNGITVVVFVYDFAIFSPKSSLQNVLNGCSRNSFGFVMEKTFRFGMCFNLIISP